MLLKNEGMSSKERESNTPSQFPPRKATSVSAEQVGLHESATLIDDDADGPNSCRYPSQSGPIKRPTQVRRHLQRKTANATTQSEVQSERDKSKQEMLLQRKSKNPWGSRDRLGSGRPGTTNNSQRPKQGYCATVRRDSINRYARLIGSREANGRCKQSWRSQMSGSKRKKRVEEHKRDF